MTRYAITPVAKPRQTQRDKWKKRPAVMAYRAFADECRLRGVDLPESGAHVIFWLPMPASWSKKKRAAHDGQPHRQRPDLSNLLKALEDAVCPDDERIWSYAGVEKRWALSGAIEIGRSARPAAGCEFPKNPLFELEGAPI